MILQTDVGGGVAPAQQGKEASGHHGAGGTNGKMLPSVPASSFSMAPGDDSIAPPWVSTHIETFWLQAYFSKGQEVLPGLASLLNSESCPAEHPDDGGALFATKGDQSVSRCFF